MTTKAASAFAGLASVLLTIQVTASRQQPSLADVLQILVDIFQMQHVPRYDDLRPITAELRARAEYFDRAGEPMSLEPDKHVVGEAPPPPVRRPGAPPPAIQPTEVLKARACAADAIVFGVLFSKEAHLNKRESLLFTDYSIAVLEWFRPADFRGTSVVVSALGGAAFAGNQIYVADVGVKIRPRTPTLFFVQRIPPAAGYAISGDPVTVDGTNLNLGLAFPADLRSAFDGPSAFFDALRQVLRSC